MSDETSDEKKNIYRDAMSNPPIDSHELHIHTDPMVFDETEQEKTIPIYDEDSKYRDNSEDDE